MKYIVSILLLAGVLGAESISLEESPLTEQLETMERSLDRHFRFGGGNSPITVVGATRSVYLGGYGAVLSIEVNLVPTANLSPCRQSYTAEEIRQLNFHKRSSMEPLLLKMREILIQDGTALSELAADEHVTLAIKLFHFPWEDRTQLPGQIVMSATRGSLLSGGRVKTQYY